MTAAAVPLSRLRAAIRWARDTAPAIEAMFDGVPDLDRWVSSRGNPVMIGDTATGGTLAASILQDLIGNRIHLVRTETRPLLGGPVVTRRSLALPDSIPAPAASPARKDIA